MGGQGGGKREVAWVVGRIVLVRDERAAAEDARGQLPATKRASQASAPVLDD
jgi:hypothetical protein